MKRPLLIEMDKAQAEWIIVAYLADDPNMLRVVEGGLDAHVVTGSLISGVPEDIVKAESEVLGHLTDPDLIEKARVEKFPDLMNLAKGFIPRQMTIRQMGKKSNHALDYDMTANRFSLENEVRQRDAKTIVDAYHNIYTGIRGTFHASVIRALEHDRTLINCFGRKRRFLGQYGNDLFKEAYAFLPQSTVADIINVAYCEIYEKETPSGLFHPITQVHDSILLEVYYTSEHQLWEGLKRVEEYMTPKLTYNGRTFTIGTDATAGYSWGEGNMSKLPLNDQYDFRRALERIEDQCA